MASHGRYRGVTKVLQDRYRASHERYKALQRSNSGVIRPLKSITRTLQRSYSGVIGPLQRITRALQRSYRSITGCYSASHERYRALQGPQCCSTPQGGRGQPSPPSIGLPSNF